MQALNWVSPLIIYVLFPLCLLAVAKEYYKRNSRRDDLAGYTGFSCLIFCTFQLFSILVYTIPHVIGTSIILLASVFLLRLVREAPGHANKHLVPACGWLVACGLFHAPSTVYLGLLIVSAVWIAGYRRLFLAMALCGVVALLVTPIGERALGYLVRAATGERPVAYYFGLLWWNFPSLLTPQMVFFGAVGFRMWRRGWGRAEWLVLASVLFPLSFVWIDPSFRPLHNVCVALSVPAADGFRRFWREARWIAVVIALSSIGFQVLMLAGNMLEIWGVFEQYGIT
jgi:hypothetical protein